MGREDLSENRRFSFKLLLTLLLIGLFFSSSSSSYTGGSRCNSSGEYMNSWLKGGMNQAEIIQEFFSEG